MRGYNIQCNFKCDFGIQVGPRPWYVHNANPYYFHPINNHQHSRRYNPIDNVYGGVFTANQITAAGILIDVDGGGVPTIPVSIYANGLLQPSASWKFACGIRPGALLNISPGSYVDRKGDAFPITQNPMNGCY